MSPALAGRFFTTSTTEEAPKHTQISFQCGKKSGIDTASSILEGKESREDRKDKVHEARNVALPAMALPSKLERGNAVICV